jgi:hypothetical protein
MSKKPVAAAGTEGRTFDTDWTIANVAKLLRANAGRGVWRDAAVSTSARAVNQYYLRTVSARHLPSELSMIFLRLEEEECWYLSLYFAGGAGPLPWNAELAELWLCALFGEDRPRVQETSDSGSNPRNFTLSMAG